MDLHDLIGYHGSSEYTRIHCPFHPDDDPSYTVWVDHAHCFGCGAHETAKQFAARVGANPDDFSVTTHSPVKKKATDSYSNAAWQSLFTIWHRCLIAGPREHRLCWLLNRGLWRSTVLQYGLGHTGDRFSIPIYDVEGRWGYQLRLDPAYCDKYGETRYLTSRTGAQTFRPNPRGSPLVVCEGPLDALLLAQYGLDSLTTVGGSASLAKQLRGYLNPYQFFYIATDLDTAGEEAAAQLERGFSKAMRVYWNGGKDVTEAINHVTPIERGRYVRDLFS